MKKFMSLSMNDYDNLPKDKRDILKETLYYRYPTIYLPTEDLRVAARLSSRERHCKYHPGIEPYLNALG